MEEGGEREKKGRRMRKNSTSNLRALIFTLLIIYPIIITQLQMSTYNLKIPSKPFMTLHKIMQRNCQLQNHINHSYNENEQSIPGSTLCAEGWRCDDRK